MNYSVIFNLAFFHVYSEFFLEFPNGNYIRFELRLTMHLDLRSNPKQFTSYFVQSIRMFLLSIHLI